MKKILLILIIFSAQIFSQEVDITPALQKIESGRIKEAETMLQDLKSKNPDNLDIIFLDAVLTKDGNESVKKYSIIIDKFPHSKYADAALYRVFSFYYSLGFYKKAGTYSDKLKKEYPDSPYLKTANDFFPKDEQPDTALKTTRLDSLNEVKTKRVTAVNQNHTPEIVKQKPVDSTAFNFTIQAGAFLNADNAKNLCARLNKENYLTEITTKEIGGSTLNIVSVGKFEKEEDATPLLNYLEKNFNLKGRVIKLPNQQ